MTNVVIHPPEDVHRCLVAFAKCGCIAAVTVLDHGHDADAYKSAAAWTRRGERVEMMTVAAFRAVPWRCTGHPDGAWDSRGRLRPLRQPDLGL